MGARGAISEERPNSLSEIAFVFLFFCLFRHRLAYTFMLPIFSPTALFTFYFLAENRHPASPPFIDVSIPGR